MFVLTLWLKGGVNHNYDLASSLPLFAAASCCGASAVGSSKLQGGRMPACLKGVLVDRFRVVKCLLVA